jgi:hypothetical protein
MSNSKEYEELETRVENLRANEQRLSVMSNTGIWLIFPVFLPYLLASSLLGLTSGNWQIWAILIPLSAFWLLATFRLARAVKKFKVEDNEWATFYSHLILENLELRTKSKTDELKKDYQMKATEYAKEFLSRVEKRWKIGSFKLVRDSFDKPLSEFKKNLRYRIVSRLKEGNEDELGRVEAMMRNLLYLSKNLKLEDLLTLNEQMSKLPTTESLKIGFGDRMKNYFNAHKIMKDAVFVSTFLVVCSVFYYLAVTYIVITKEVAFGGAVALFVGFITVYFRRQSKQ